MILKVLSEIRRNFQRAETNILLALTIGYIFIRYHSLRVTIAKVIRKMFKRGEPKFSTAVAPRPDDVSIV